MKAEQDDNFIILSGLITMGRNTEDLITIGRNFQPANIATNIMLNTRNTRFDIA